MPTKHSDLFARLAAPFEPHEVKVRSQSGKQLHYVTARTVMNRLDDVLGPENWWSRVEVSTVDSVICHLSVRLPDGVEVTKCDLGGCAGMPDAGDDDKSAASDGLKRAAVHLGVGRYLYRDGVPAFARGDAPAAARGPGDDLPRAEPSPAPTRAPEPGPAHANHEPGPGDPRSGKALFRWAKDREEEFQVGLVKYLSQWGKLQDFPGRMVEWDADQVALALAESRRKIAAYQAAASNATEEAIAN